MLPPLAIKVLVMFSRDVHRIRLQSQLLKDVSCEAPTLEVNSSLSTHSGAGPYPEQKLIHAPAEGARRRGEALIADVIFTKAV